MNGMVELLSTPTAQRVGWALVHFLWQGTAVALLLAVLLQLLRRRSPQARWAVSCLALAAMAALPAVTACMVSVDLPEAAPVVGTSTARHASEAALVGMEPPPSPVLPAVSFPPVEDPAPVPANSSSELPAGAADHRSARPWLQRAEDILHPFLPWAVVAWLVGVTGMSLWHVGGWLQVRRLRHSGARPADSAILDTFGRLLQRLRVRHRVRLLESVRVAVPVVVGWLRPVILLPASALSGLSPTQVDAVLAHELAHIRRWDCLFRLLQAVVETLLFYHPGVWWVSRRIREESENCCDDIAAEVCGDRKGYARALARIAALGRGAPSLAAAATGGKLLPRIRRIVGLTEDSSRGKASWLSAAVLVTALAMTSLIVVGRLAAGQASTGKAKAEAVSTAPATQPAAKGSAEEQLQHLWVALGSADVKEADRDVKAMVALGDRAVTFLAERLAPAPVRADEVRQLIAGLDSDRAAVRVKSHTQLEELGSAALATMRKALKRQTLSPEVRGRLDKLVRDLTMPHPIMPRARRADRAVQVLRGVATKEARQLLTRLAKGHADDRYTKLARAALVRMSAARVARGIVRDSAGRPVEGAEVALYYRGSNWGWDNRIVETVRSGRDGRFRFTSPLVYRHLQGTSYTDYYVLLATHPKYAIGWKPLFSGDKDTPGELVLTEPAKQSFFVTDTDGKPVAGARVWLYGAGDQVDANPVLRVYLHVPEDLNLIGATTDAAGRATVTNLPKTRWAFKASHKGFADKFVSSGKLSAKVTKARLWRAGVVSGTVKTSAGKPVEGAVVWFEADWNLHCFWWAKTDQKGRFKIDHLTPRGGSWAGNGGNGRYRVRLRHDHYTAARASVQLEPGQVVENFDIVASRGTLILGRVVEPGTGRPMPGARITGQTASGVVNAYADQMGEFRWRVMPGEAYISFNTPPRDVYVLVSKFGMPSLRPMVQGKQMALTMEAPSVARPITALPVKALKPDGAPAEAVRVYATVPIRYETYHGNIVHRTVTNADGTCKLKLVPTEQRLVVYGETEDRKWACWYDFRVPSAEKVSQINLRLSRCVSANVLIKDASGKLWPNKKLSIRPVIGGQPMTFYYRQAKTDGKGYLKIDGVIPGLPYVLSDPVYAWKAPRGYEHFPKTTLILAPAATGKEKPSATPAPNGASTQPAGKAVFGPVVERLVNDDGAGKNCLIDLDTGRLYSPPRHVKGKDKIAAWFRDKGIDAGAETNPAGAGLWLWGLEMVVIPVASKLWDEDPLLGIRDELERGKPGTPAVMSALGNLPRTYVFKTREGGIGVLQILAVRNDIRPRHIKIRYKILQRPKTKKPPTPPATQPGPSVSASVQLISADAKAGRYQWRIRRDKPARMIYGWVASDSKGKPIGAYEGGAKVATKDFILDVLRKGDNLHISVGDIYASPPGGGQGRMYDKTSWPKGATLRCTHLARPDKLTNARYLALWKGNFVRDGKVVKHVVFYARVATQADPVVHMFGKEDVAQAVLPLPKGLPATQLGEGAVAWGAPVDGVAVRLRPDFRVRTPGEFPTFSADVRNRGTRELSVYRAKEPCELEVDGQWYRWGGDIGVKSSPLPPGREYKDIHISLFTPWKSKKDSKRLTLSPGKHTVRVAFICRPAGKDAAPPVRAISNRVEIEVISLAPAKDSAGD